MARRIEDGNPFPPAQFPAIARLDASLQYIVARKEELREQAKLSAQQSRDRGTGTQVFAGRLVPIELAQGAQNRRLLAAEHDWQPEPLEMVGFDIPYSVREARPRSCPQYAAEFNDVRVVAGIGAVLDPSAGEIISDSVYRNHHRISTEWYAKYGLDVVDARRSHCTIAQPDGPSVANAVSLFSWENRNYAHWLLEKLPSMHWIGRAVLPDDTVLLVETGLPATVIASLELFWPRERILFVERGTAVNVKRLYYFSEAAEIWEPRDGYRFDGSDYRICPEAMRWLAGAVPDRIPAAASVSRSAYLIRPDHGHGRTVTNQGELIASLKQRGWDCIQPATLDFGDQVSYFSGLDFAVSPSGAALANMLWMPPGSKIVVLAIDVPEMIYWFYHSLAAALGIRLVFFPVKGIEHGTLPKFHWDTEVPVDALIDWLDRDTAGAETTHPLVSVCIASYNHADYIGEALQSVLAQAYPNLEIIVADDASTDNSAEVIRRYEEMHPDQVRALFKDSNSGPSETLNQAIALARGEFIALLGSDDRMLPGRLDAQVEYMLAHSQCTAVFTDIRTIDASGNPAPSGLDAFFNTSFDHLRHKLLGGNFLNAPSALIRAASLRAVGGFSPLLRYTQDFEAWIKLLTIGNLAKLPEVLTEYRVHGKNLSIEVAKDSSFQLYCELAWVIRRAAASWPIESWLPPGDRGCPQALAKVRLELARHLVKTDSTYFKRSLICTPLAYELVLDAADALTVESSDFKQALESWMQGGQLPQDLQPGPLGPFLPGGKFPDEDGGAKPAAPSLEQWLDRREFTATQQGLVTRYLATAGLRIGVLVLVPEEGGNALEATLSSLQADEIGRNVAEVHVLSPAAGIAAYEGLAITHHAVHGGGELQAINATLQAGGFDWFVVVHAGDRFTSSGLTIVAQELAGSPHMRAVYADEIMTNASGQLAAMLRPDFNLDLLLSMPSAMARHWIYRRDVVVEAGGFDPAFAESPEYELLLRLIDAGGLEGLGHVDEPLLLARATEIRTKQAEIDALQRHLRSRGYDDSQVSTTLPGCYRVTYGHPAQPGVSVIVPTRNRLNQLRRCLETLLEKTSYRHYEVLIVDNESTDEDARTWLAGVEAMDSAQMRVLRFTGEYNRAAMINHGARHARGDYLLLLDPDAAVIKDDWLDAMVNHAQRPEVGIVGAKLLHNDGSIQHAGMLLGLRDIAGSPFLDLKHDDPGYMLRLQVDQNYSAVSGACLMVRREVFEQAGTGLDQATFPQAFFDIDLCLKVRNAGYLVVWTPHAVLMHDPAPDRSSLDQAGLDGERTAMLERWLPLLARDPAYNQNLTLAGGGHQVDTGNTFNWRPLRWRPLPVAMAMAADQFGCGRYRIIEPVRAMNESGVAEAHCVDRYHSPLEIERISPDVIVLQRQMFKEKIEPLKKLGRFTRTFKVAELDDYLPNLPRKSAHSGALPKDILKTIRESLKFVDRFVVSTPALAEAFAGMHADIRVVENHLPPHWWANLQGKRRDGKRPRVGWGGGAGHRGDLELVADVVQALAGEVDWVFFGMCPDKLRPYVREFHPGVAIDQYPARLAGLDLDLAIAPLEDNLFNQCKSNLRLLEYGACGFPVVCSDVRPYQCDLPVTRVKPRFRDWVDAIRMHTSDLDAAARAGQALRATVHRDWMLDEAHARFWLSQWLPD